MSEPHRKQRRHSSVVRPFSILAYYLHTHLNPLIAYSHVTERVDVFKVVFDVDLHALAVRVAEQLLVLVPCDRCELFQHRHIYNDHRFIQPSMLASVARVLLSYPPPTHTTHHTTHAFTNIPLQCSLTTHLFPVIALPLVRCGH